MDKFFECADGARLFYRVDDFTDPWRACPTVVFVHGFAESGEVWRGWVPHFARRYRVVRVDLRGFGRSTPMPENFAWTVDGLVADLAAFIRHLDCGPVHVVSAKSGGALAFKLAAQHPGLMRTLTGVSPVVRPFRDDHAEWITQIREQGMPAWARATNSARLGSSVSPAEFEWWANELHGKTPVSTVLGYLHMVPSIDVSGDLDKIICPTLIIRTEGSGSRSIESYKEWQPRIRNSELLTIEGDAYHPSAVYPDRCAQATLPFVDRH